MAESYWIVCNIDKEFIREYDQFIKDMVKMIYKLAAIKGYSSMNIDVFRRLNEEGECTTTILIETHEIPKDIVIDIIRSARRMTLTYHDLIDYLEELVDEGRLNSVEDVAACRIYDLDLLGEERYLWKITF